MEPKTKKLIIIAFFKFLRKHGCLRKYFFNIGEQKKRGGDNAHKSRIKLLMYGNFSCLILHAFTWVDTPEGEVFWVRLSHEWTTEYKILKNRIENGNRKE